MARGARATGWRRIAVAIWGPPRDPQIYGELELDAGSALAFLERARAAGHRVGPTQLVGRALALALRGVPELNTRLLRGRFLPRPSVDVFFITAVGGGRDLSGVKVERVDEKPAVEIGDELLGRARELRQGRDLAFKRAKARTERLPLFLLRPLLRLAAWIAGARAHAVEALGLEASPFGSAMVSSVGMLGLPHGYSPLVWLYHVPLLVLVGELAERPVVVEGQVVARPVLPICVTLDHRYVDGFLIAELARQVRAYFDDVGSFEPALGAATEPAAPSPSAPSPVAP
jgi:pyruvate dehydrogenase E2 component (dihydrolipoamide acetyltransferase)